MAVLRPNISEDERLQLTQKYEEGKIKTLVAVVAGGGLYVDVFNIGVIPLAYAIKKKTKPEKPTLTWMLFCMYGRIRYKRRANPDTSCNHIFHTDCIQHWFKTNSTCPLCRRSVISPVKTPNISANSRTDNIINTRPVIIVPRVHQDTSLHNNSSLATNPSFLRSEDIEIQMEVSSSL